MWISTLNCLNMLHVHVYVFIVEYHICSRDFEPHKISSQELNIHNCTFRRNRREAGSKQEAIIHRNCDDQWWESKEPVLRRLGMLSFMTTYFPDERLIALFLHSVNRKETWNLPINSKTNGNMRCNSFSHMGKKSI